MKKIILFGLLVLLIIAPSLVFAQSDWLVELQKKVNNLSAAVAKLTEMFNHSLPAALSTATDTASPFTFITPVQGEIWGWGMAKEIRFKTKALDISNVRFDIIAPDGRVVYSPCTGCTFPVVNGSGLIIFQVTPIQISGDSTVSKNLRIRLFGNHDSYTIPYPSPFTFTVQQTPPIQILAPAGGEQLAVGATTTLRWQTSGLPAGSSLLVSLKNLTGQTIHTFSTINDGQETVTVPNAPALANGYKYEISYRPMWQVLASATSNLFSIINMPSLTILYPNGGETFSEGTTTTIRWISRNFPIGQSFDIVLSYGPRSDFIPLATSTPNDGRETVRLIALNGDNATLPTQFQLEFLSPGAHSEPYAMSNVFSILPAEINILSPSNGAVWPIGSTQTVRWTSSPGLESNDLVHLSFGNGAVSMGIEPSSPNDGYETIIVPDYQLYLYQQPNVTLFDIAATPENQTNLIRSIAYSPVIKVYITPPNTTAARFNVKEWNVSPYRYIEGAVITARSTVNGQTYTATTDAGGEAAVLGLPLGGFTYTVAKSGFQTYSGSDATISPPGSIYRGVSLHRL